MTSESSTQGSSLSNMQNISGWRVLLHRKICRVDTSRWSGSTPSQPQLQPKRLEVIFSDEAECRRLFEAYKTSPEVLTVELQFEGRVVERMDLLTHEV